MDFDAFVPSDMPVVEYIAPFFVYTAICQLTTCTMWFGPTARLRSDGSPLPGMPSK
jgi:hypothetical protein